MKKNLFNTLVLILLATQVGLAKEIIVSTTADSGEGSLRAAILEANSNQGVDRIVFNIPMTDKGYLAPKITGQNGWAFFIRLEKALPEVTDRVIVDGQSQTRFTGDTNSAIPGVSTGAEVIIFHQDDMQSWAQNATLTASNLPAHTQNVYASQIDLVKNDRHQDIMEARGGKLPMR